MLKITASKVKNRVALGLKGMKMVLLLVSQVSAGFHRDRGGRAGMIPIFIFGGTGHP